MPLNTERDQIKVLRLLGQILAGGGRLRTSGSAIIPGRSDGSRHCTTRQPDHCATYPSHRHIFPDVSAFSNVTANLLRGAGRTTSTPLDAPFIRMIEMSDVAS